MDLWFFIKVDYLLVFENIFLWKEHLNESSILDPRPLLVVTTENQFLSLKFSFITGKIKYFTFIIRVFLDLSFLTLHL